MARHKNLIVFQKADELAFQIYKITEFFPKNEMFGLTSQIRRAALSVPTNIVELMKLGEPGRLGIKTIDLQDAFYSFLGYTRLTTVAVLQKAISEGIKEKIFGYFSGAAPALGPDNKFQVTREKVLFDRTISEDEIDMESGFLMIHDAIPVAPEETIVVIAGTEQQPITEPATPIQQPSPQPTGMQKITNVRFAFEATRAQLFKVWNAIANLADKTGKVKVQVNAQSDEGLDPTWLRNAVEEPFEEADISVEKED